jgi:hypothetical protein
METNASAHASAVPPTRFCNPLSIPNYPVGRLAREVKRGDPAADPGPWRLDRAEQYRELADPSAIWWDGKWIVYPSCDMAWVSHDEGRTWAHRPLNVRDVGYAPTVVRHRGKFLLMASESAIYAAADPLGPFESLGKVEMTRTPGVPGLSDPMLFSDDDGRLYLYFGTTSNGGIWGVELDADRPTRTVGKPRELIQFQPVAHPWERAGHANQNPACGWLEGAWMLKHQGRYYLTYSAGGTEYRGYAMGCYIGESPLGEFRAQRRNPILRNTHGLVIGTSHGCVVAGPRGRLWAFYTVLASVAHYFERRIGMDVVEVDEQGELCVPTATSTPQALPGDAESEPWLPLNLGERTTGSTNAPNLTGRFAVDHAIHTWWQPADGDETPTLTSRLICPSTVRGVRVIWRDVGLDTTRGVVAGPMRYRVEAETTPDAWVVLIDASTNEQDMLIDYRECTPTRATRVRLSIVGQPNGITPAVTDFSAFGTMDYGIEAGPG